MTTHLKAILIPFMPHHYVKDNIFYLFKKKKLIEIGL